MSIYRYKYDISHSLYNKRMDGKELKRNCFGHEKITTTTGNSLHNWADTPPQNYVHIPDQKKIPRK
jgi:hypothetical protein